MKRESNMWMKLLVWLLSLKTWDKTRSCYNSTKIWNSKCHFLVFANDFTEFGEKQVNGQYSAPGRLVLRDFFYDPFLEKAHPNVKDKMKKLMVKDSLNDGLSELFEIIIGKFGAY